MTANVWRKYSWQIRENKFYDASTHFIVSRWIQEAHEVERKANFLNIESLFCLNVANLLVLSHVTTGRVSWQIHRNRQSMKSAHFKRAESRKRQILVSSRGSKARTRGNKKKGVNTWKYPCTYFNRTSVEHFNISYLKIYLKEIKRKEKRCQPVLIPSLSGIDIWSQPFAAASRRRCWRSRPYCTKGEYSEKGGGRGLREHTGLSSRKLENASRLKPVTISWTQPHYFCAWTSWNITDTFCLKLTKASLTLNQVRKHGARSLVQEAPRVPG